MASAIVSIDLRGVKEYKRMFAALYVAANEAYFEEVEVTGMEGQIIGEGREYESRGDWIQARIEAWKEEADRILRDS